MSLATQERLLLKGDIVPWQSGMDLRHWYPVCVERDAGTGEVLMCWRDLKHMRFSDSFFENTLARQPRDARRVCRTPLAALGSIEHALQPTAFIFHVSRCGSTLLTQMLATLPHCVVLSEPTVIDSLLRLHHERGGSGDNIDSIDSINTLALLRQAILALGQRRSSGETRYVIKFDCWHIHSLALLQQAFPDTPCLFLYREPQAVLASHQRQRGPQMIPGMLHPALLPLADHHLPSGDLDGYTAVVLASLYAAAHAAASASKLQLINYSQLPAIVFDDLLARLDIAATCDQLKAMRARSGVHAKYGTAFQGDAKVAEVAEAAQACRLNALSTEILPGYVALETLRMANA